MEVDGALITPIAAIFRGLPHRAIVPTEPVDSVRGLDERKQHWQSDWDEGSEDASSHMHFADGGDHAARWGVPAARAVPVRGAAAWEAPVARAVPLREEQRQEQEEEEQQQQQQQAPVVAPMQAAPSPARQIMQEREMAQKRRLDWMKIGCVMFKFHFTSNNVEPVSV